MHAGREGSGALMTVKREAFGVNNCAMRSYIAHFTVFKEIASMSLISKIKRPVLAFAVVLGLGAGIGFVQKLKPDVFI